MQKKKNRFVAGAAVIFLAALALQGCVKGPDAQATVASTYLSLVHVSAAAPSVDFYINDQKVTQVLNFGTYFPAYAKLAPATFDIKFKKTGTDSLVASVPSASYDSAQFYTVIVYNDPAGNGAKAIRITDDYTNVNGNTAFYRFYNMSDAPSVDLYINSLKVESSRHPADNTSSYFFNSFQPIAAGSYYPIIAKKAGTDSVIATLSSTSFAQGNVYTIYLQGQLGAINDKAPALHILQSAY